MIRLVVRRLPVSIPLALSSGPLGALVGPAAIEAGTDITMDPGRSGSVPSGR